MTNAVFPTFQTQYILDVSSAIHSGKVGFAKHCEIFQSKDVASAMSSVLESLVTTPRFET
jgi:hypothetical protein